MYVYALLADYAAARNKRMYYIRQLALQRVNIMEGTAPLREGRKERKGRRQESIVQAGVHAHQRVAWETAAEASDANKSCEVVDLIQYTVGVIRRLCSLRI